MGDHPRLFHSKAGGPLVTVVQLRQVVVNIEVCQALVLGGLVLTVPGRSGRRSEQAAQGVEETD
jgi:hypothetical protein